MYPQFYLPMADISLLYKTYSGTDKSWYSLPTIPSRVPQLKARITPFYTFYLNSHDCIAQLEDATTVFQTNWTYSTFLKPTLSRLFGAPPVLSGRVFVKPVLFFFPFLVFVVVVVSFYSKKLKYIFLIVLIVAVFRVIFFMSYLLLLSHSCW